jgi:hypothetical protein
MIIPTHVKQTTSKRMAITVSGYVYALLEDISTQQGRSMSNLVAFIVEHYLTNQLKDL